MASLSMELKLGFELKLLLQMLRDERIDQYIRTEYGEKFLIEEAIYKLEKSLKENNNARYKN